MKLSVNWLKEYVDVNMPVTELADRLTMTGLEVEELKEAPKSFFIKNGGCGVSDDFIFNVKVTPNRGDWMSILGVAREAAPICNCRAKLPAGELVGNGAPSSDSVKITVKNPEFCPRYVGIVARNVKVGKSPDWMIDRLIAAGMRPINNVVDITNYVMLELGQPLHAFDLNLIAGKEIIVRTASDGDTIKTIDGEERKLTNDTLVIADKEKPIAIAGVMGGFDSEISDDAKDVLIESANFDSVCVRKTSKRLELTTEASYRYERSVDINIAYTAACRVASLLAEYADAEIACEAIDVYPSPVAPMKLSAKISRINSMLGTSLDAKTMVDYLKSLEIDVCYCGDVLECTIPTFRVDIEKEIDITEEIGRMFGYDNLEATLPSSSGGGHDTQQGVLREKIRKTLISSALQEVLTHSLVSSKLSKICAKTDTMLKIKNPMNEDLDVMRSAIVPNLLGVVERNQALGTNDVFIFETGKVYYNTKEKGIGETLSVAGLMVGNMWDGSWSLDTSYCTADFYMCKGVVENLLERLGISDVSFVAEKVAMYHPTRCAKIFAGKVELGVVGEISSEACKFFDINGRPCAFELDFDSLVSVTPSVLRHSELSRYPGLYRHIAAVVDDEISCGDMLSLIRSLGGEIMESVEMIDFYKGKPIDDDKKSLTFAMVFRSMDGTLKDDEVNKVMDCIKSGLNDKFGCSFRG